MEKKRKINTDDSEETQENRVIVGQSLCQETLPVKCPQNGCWTDLKIDQKLCNFHQRKKISSGILVVELCTSVSSSFGESFVESVPQEKLILSREERGIHDKQCRVNNCPNEKINSRKFFCPEHITTELNDSGRCYTLCPRKEKNFVQNPDCWKYNEYQCDCGNSDRSMCTCKKITFCFSCRKYMQKL